MNQIRSLIAIIFLALLSCNDPAKLKEMNDVVVKTQSNIKDSIIIQEDKVHMAGKKDSIFNEIIKIPEIVNFNNLLNKKHRNLNIWIADTIRKNNKNYIIYNIGEDNGFAMVGEYHFAIEINNNTILAYDVIDDTIMTLQAWRQKANKKNQ